jgi:hypothetical protein
MKTKQILSLMGIALLISACGESENTDSFVDSVSNGVTCSHSLEDNPMVNEVEQHLSTVSIVANKTILRKKIESLSLGVGNHILPVVAKLKTKDGNDVVRTGDYLVQVDENNELFPFNQLVVGTGLGGIPVNKEEFINTFGAYPSITCELL